MRFTAWLLVVAALFVLGSLGGLLLSSAERTPENLLESAVRRTHKADPDYRAALNDLETAFTLALKERDDVLIGDILLQQGRIHRTLGALGPAKNDFETVIDQYRPGDLLVEMELVAIDKASGDLNAALDRATRVLQRDPTFTPAWTYRGQILVEISDRHVARCDEILHSVVPAEVAEAGLALVKRIVGMDLTDEFRVSMLHELRNHFSIEEELQAREILREVDRASQVTADARDAFARSFSGQLNREAILSYAQLLLDSGRPIDAIDFGLAVVHHGAANSSAGTMKLLMEAMTDAGRAEDAAQLIEEHLGRRVFPSQDFYLSWCNTLHAAERWQNLLFFAHRMRASGDPDHRRMANFYIGLSLQELGNHLEARIALERYTKEDSAEPFPGALGEAWRLLAISSRELGALFTEKTALRAAIELAPDRDGELYLRLAEILEKTENASFFEAERHVAHAIRLMPERDEELMPRWRALGESSLRTSGVSIEILRTDLRRRRLFTPATPSGPYELFRLAELHRENAEPTGVVHACQRLLNDYPGFKPALDMYIAASLRLEDNQVAAQLMLERLELFGDDSRTVRRLLKVPEGTLDSQQRLRLMQLNPQFVGRLAVAQTLRDEGRHEQALNGLISLGLEGLGDEGLLLAGELMLEVGRYVDALSTLRGINKGSPDYAHALPTRVRAALLLGDGGWIRKILLEPVRADQIDGAELRPVADELILKGFARQAQNLLELLDAHPETRSGEGLLTAATVAMLQDDHALAQECLERADAFGRTSLPDFGRMLIAVEEEAWGTLPLKMAAVIERQPSSSLLFQAAMALLDERVDDGLRMIEIGSLQEPDEPLWPILGHAAAILRAEPVELDPLYGPDNEDETYFVLHGFGSGKRDPRPLLARIAALEIAAWRPWAVAKLQTVRAGDRSTLWPTFLAARGYADMGYDAQARERLEELLERWPTFGPAWNLLEDLEFRRLGRIDHIELVRLRHQRRKVLEIRPQEEAEEKLTQAWAAEATGNLDRAMRAARESLAIDPDLLPARFKLAQLHQQRENYDASIRAYQEAFQIAPEEHTQELTEEFLSVLEEAHEKDPDGFPRPLLQAELETLARERPRDPLVALALAQEVLDSPGVSPALRVAAAYDRLERFRQATRWVPIESLRPGATRRWKDFYARLDPARAEEFVQRELEMRPGSLDLWTMLGETKESQGRLEEAIMLYEVVQSMVPDETGQRRIASLLATLARDHARVEESLRTAQALGGLGAPDKEMLLIRARSLFHVGAEEQDQALDMCSELWRRRDDADPSIDAAEIGQVYGTLLVQRGDPADRDLAYEVLENVSGMLPVGGRQNLVDALKHLGKQIPIRRRRARDVAQRR